VNLAFDMDSLTTSDAVDETCFSSDRGGGRRGGGGQTSAGAGCGIAFPHVVGYFEVSSVRGWNATTGGAVPSHVNQSIEHLKVRTKSSMKNTDTTYHLNCYAAQGVVYSFTCHVFLISSENAI